MPSRITEPAVAVINDAAAKCKNQMAMVFVGTEAYGAPGSPFHLARSLAGRAAAPFDDLVTLADSADAVVAAMTAVGSRSGHTG